MIKLTFCLHRLPSLSRDEFQRYWREQHAPLVAHHAATLRIRRYVQTHSLPDGDPVNAGLRASRGGPEDYDGVAELWWDSLDDLAAATASATRRCGRRSRPRWPRRSRPGPAGNDDGGGRRPPPEPGP